MTASPEAPRVAAMPKETPAQRKKRREQMPMYGGTPSALDVLAEQLAQRAIEQGVDLVGPNGLLAELTRRVLQAGLDAEMTSHLGHEWHAASADGSGNSRKGYSAKTVTTDIGTVDLRIPRDRAGSFDPQIVPKHVRRLPGFDRNVLDLYAKGLTTGEIRAHLAEIYDTEVSAELISTVTDAIAEELADWHNRPLDRVYAVLFVDCIYVKIRDGAVANRPVYLVVGIDLAGQRDVLGMWVGAGGEGAKHWTSVLGELRNRGVGDVLMVCCDGLTGLPEAIEFTWPQARVQTCVVHLLRTSARYTSTKDVQHVMAALKPIYTAPTVEAAEARLADFEKDWGVAYPAVVQTWKDAWEAFIPFLALPPEVRTLVYTTNMIESLNARIRSVVTRHGHFPNEAAAKKVIYLNLRDHGKWRRGGNVVSKVRNWKRVLNALIMFYGERIILP